jgi:hypothetical protein
MKQQLLRTASVCALVVAMGGAAFAQTGGSGGGGGGSSSPSGSSPSGPSTAPQTQQKKPGADTGEPRGEARPGQGSSGETTRPKGGAAQGPSDRQPNATQRSDDRAAPRKQDRSDTRDEKQRTPQASGERKDDGKRASDRARDKDDGKRASDRGRDKDDGKRASDRRQDKERTRAGQDQRERGDRGRQGQADRDRSKDGDARRDRADRDRDGATRLSEQQRTTVRERFSRSGVERNRVTNVDFDIRVGASVPRSMTLHALPSDIVEVVPEYRSYRYVYARDDIVIVDPSSYAVVAVISSSGNRAAGRGRNIVLAPADRVYVREHVDTGASIRLGIGGLSIGMDVPQGVGLQPLPSVVVDRYPDLRDHRYFVYEDDIAIVDPSTDEVVLVIED